MCLEDTISFELRPIKIWLKIIRLFNFNLCFKESVLYSLFVLEGYL